MSTGFIKRSRVVAPVGDLYASCEEAAADGLLTGEEYTLEYPDGSGNHLYTTSALFEDKMDFGRSSSINADGSLMVVGDYEANVVVEGNVTTNAGKVHVYTCTATSATRVSTLHEAEGEATPGNLFGKSVCLSGDGQVLAVGVPGKMLVFPGPTFVSDAGIVNIYDKVGNDFVFRYSITSPFTEANQNFGEAVVLNEDGSVILISFPYENGYNSDNSGFVRMDVGPSSASMVSGYVNTHNPGSSPHFGVYLAANADLSLVCGLSLFDSTLPAGNDVTVFLLEWTGAGYDESSVLTPPIDATSGFYNGTLALSPKGNVMAIGNEYATVGGHGNAGEVLVYHIDNGLPELKGTLTEAVPQDEGRFGSSLSMSNRTSNILIVGSKGYSPPVEAVDPPPSRYGRVLRMSLNYATESRTIDCI